METCLVFGGGAHYYEKNNLGRIIDQQEALGLLKEAEKHALVLQPSNSKKPVNICMCCGCCCQILKNMKNLDKPARHVNTSHVAVVDEDRKIALPARCAWTGARWTP